MTRAQALEIINREIAWIRRNEKYQAYEPNGPVTDFIRLIGEVDEKGFSKSLVYVLSAANGIGKTTAIVNIIASIIFGPANKYFRQPLFQKWPYSKRLRFVSEPSQIEEGGAFPTEVEKWFPRGRYQSFKDSKHYVKRYKAGDWTLEVMSYEQASDSFEGQNLSAVFFNEPPPENLWTPNISRLRAGGIAVVGMTPLTEAGWFFDKVVPRYPDSVIYADVETACIQHGTRGHLEHDHIERMIGEYSEEEREARIDGKAMHLQGLIYKMFNHRVHVLKDPIQAPANATIYQAVDPHTDKPFACIWAFVDGKGDVYIVDEWPNIDFYKWRNCQLTIQDYAKIFRDKEQGMNIHRRIIDRHFADVRSAINKRTLREELRDDVGLDFFPSYQAQEEIETGIIKVRDYLKYNPDRPIEVYNKPRLFINPHCQNTIKSFLRWSRDPKTGKVNDSYKDFMDCVRYLCMESPEVDVPIPSDIGAPIKRW